MNIGIFNMRGINKTEHFIPLEIKELKKREHNVTMYWARGRHPTKKEVKEMDFAVFHFVPTALHFMRSVKVPFCVLPTANDIFIDEGKNLKQVEKHKNCKFVGYQSIYHKNKYIEWGVEKPIVYVPHCVRVDLFTRKKPFNPNDKIIAGGRLIAKKGLDRVIPYVDNLTVFGDGELMPHLKSLNPTTKFTGYLNGEELKDLFEEGWLYLFPAVVDEFGDREGVSNTIKEAMLMELQILTTTVGGNAELDNVYFLDDWNKKSIENAIDAIPREPNVKGREEIIKKYSPKVCVDKLLKGIKEYA